MTAKPALAPISGTPVCDCAQPVVHVHPDQSHWCSWCAGFLGNPAKGDTLKKGVHLIKGVCACPPCPPNAHIRRRCR